MSFRAASKCCTCCSLVSPMRPRHQGRSAASPAAPLGACSQRGQAKGQHRGERGGAVPQLLTIFLFTSGSYALHIQSSALAKAESCQTRALAARRASRNCAALAVCSPPNQSPSVVLPRL